MDIIVCIKQVPEEFKIDPRNGTLVRQGVGGVINACDKNALEMALELKEGQEGKITLVTMGPSQAEDSLLEGLAMGADEAVLLCDRDFTGADTLATSYTMAMAIRKVGSFDLIICGKETADSGTGQVGAQIAGCLQLTQVTYVTEIEVRGDKLRARRMLEGEYEIVEVKLPALITVPKGINQPRLPDFAEILRASHKPIFKWSAHDIGADISRVGAKGSPTHILSVVPIQAKRRCEVLSGTPDGVAAQLASKLGERGIVFGRRTDG